MNSIKNFIYLDDYKMYSISSQIFEGMTEYIIQRSLEKTEENTIQKGEFFSGQVMADIITTERDDVQKKFLHDYSYTLFENKLIEDGKVLIIDDTNTERIRTDGSVYSFIKITGRVVFNDTKQIEEVISKFNELGIALIQITHKEMFDEAEKFSAAIKNMSDRNQKSKAQQTITRNTKVADIAKSNSLYLRPEYLKSLKTVLNYGYNEQFEIQVPLTDGNTHLLFSALLNRNNLKESELSIVKKFGRISEKSFTVFGILTQVKNEKEELEFYEDKSDSADENTSMKEAIRNIIFHLTNVESTFTGKLNYEYVIDPIAVYQQI